MNKDYEVGYGKPPKKYQFGPGNQAAAGKGKRRRAQTISIPEILDAALSRRRKIKRGDQVVSMTVGQIMIERLIQAASTGTVPDMLKILALIEQHAPKMFEQQALQMQVTYHRAEGSTAQLPVDDDEEDL